MQSYFFVYWTYIKKTCEWGPVYIEKNFPGVTLPARVNLSISVYTEKRLTPLRKPRAENSARAWSDSLAAELTPLCKPSVFLEKSWLS